MMIFKKNDTTHQNVAACIRKLSNILLFLKGYYMPFLLY